MRPSGRATVCAQQVAAHRVGDCQRIAAPAIAGSEPTLKSADERVGGGQGRSERGQRRRGRRREVNPSSRSQSPIVLLAEADVRQTLAELCAASWNPTEQMALAQRQNRLDHRLVAGPPVRKRRRAAHLQSSTPAAPYRASHCSQFRRLIRTSRAAITASASSAATTNCIRSSIDSLEGIGGAPLSDQPVSYPQAEK